MNEQLLKELGLEKAASNLSVGRMLKKKMSIAYENYRFVSPGIFDRFKEKLKDKTLKKDKYGSIYYETLIFIPLKKYELVPPPDCLMDLKKAKDLNCFDYFEVAKIETVEVRPDPIIFGLIAGCVDKFYITQWDDDVKIEDILNEDEG